MVRERQSLFRLKLCLWVLPIGEVVAGSYVQEAGATKLRGNLAKQSYTRYFNCSTCTHKIHVIQIRVYELQRTAATVLKDSAGRVPGYRYENQVVPTIMRSCFLRARYHI